MMRVALIAAALVAAASFAPAGGSAAHETAMLRGGVSADASTEPSASASDPSRFVARYHFSGGEKELQALRDELDRIADKFNILVRPIARHKLHSRVLPYFDIRFDERDDVARVHMGPLAPLICDGKWHDVRGDSGETGRATCGPQDDKMVTRARFDEAKRNNTFTLSSDGKQLRMSTVVTSPQLPEPIRFALSYGRVE